MSSAEHYQNHKDDPDEWEEEPERQSRRASGRLSSMISARFSPDEADDLRAAAAQSGMTQSAFVREAVLGACRPHRHRLAASWLARGVMSGSGDLRRELLGSAVPSPVIIVGGLPDSHDGSGGSGSARVLINSSAP